MKLELESTTVAQDRVLFDVLSKLGKLDKDMRLDLVKVLLEMDAKAVRMDSVIDSLRRQLAITRECLSGLSD